MLKQGWDDKLWWGQFEKLLSAAIFVVHEL